MSLHLAILTTYSLGLMALGVWIGRRGPGAPDLFPARRTLGPGLRFPTMRGANIGAGSTVGATAHGYLVGASAWWWVGSAAIGSLALAFWAGPAMRRVAAAHNLETVGDYLEYRYDEKVRGVTAAILWIAAIFVLATQLIGIGSILNVVMEVPKAIGGATRMGGSTGDLSPVGPLSSP